MDIYVIVMIIVAAVALLLLWAAVAVYWRRRHIGWLRKEATHNSTLIIARRLEEFNDKAEYQIADGLLKSFPVPHFVPASCDELLEGTAARERGRRGFDNMLSNRLGGSSASAQEVSEREAVGRERSSPPLSLITPPPSLTLSPEAALRTVIVTCVRRSLAKSIETAQLRRELEEESARHASNIWRGRRESTTSNPARSRQLSGTEENSTDVSRSVTTEITEASGNRGGMSDLPSSPRPSPLLFTPQELLSSLDSAPELFAFCRVAIANIYGTIGRLIQIEGCTIFDDVHVARLTSDTSHTLDELKEKEIEKATPHATCCCLPLCCTSRGRDKERFRKYRRLFFLNVATRFCSGVDVLEPDEEIQKRLNSRDNLDDSGRQGERFTRLGDDEEEGEIRRRSGVNRASVGRNPRANNKIKYSGGSSRRDANDDNVELTAPWVGGSPATIGTFPTASDSPRVLYDFYEGKNRTRLLNMADAVSRRMVKVSAFASQRKIVSVLKPTAHNMNGGSSNNREQADGRVTRSASSATSVPATIAAAVPIMHGSDEGSSSGGMLPRRTAQQISNEEAMSAVGPHTATVVIAPHPDVLTSDETRKVIETMAMRKHYISEQLLVPAGGWDCENESGTEPGGGNARVRKSAPFNGIATLLREQRDREKPPTTGINTQIPITEDSSPHFSQRTHTKDRFTIDSAVTLRESLIKEVAGTYPSGLPLFSKEIDKQVFSFDGVRDDLIIFFTNLKRNVQNVGANLSGYNGGGKGSIDPTMRKSFPMYDCIQRFDYHCKRWLLQAALIVSSETARAYYHYTHLRIQTVTLVAVNRAQERISKHAAGGKANLPPTVTATTTSPPISPKRKVAPRHVDPNISEEEAIVKNLQSAVRSKHAAECEHNQNDGKNESLPLPFVPPVIRVRTPKVNRVQLRIQRELALFVESCHKQFVICGLVKEGSLTRCAPSAKGGGGGGGFVVDIFDIPFLSSFGHDNGSDGGNRGEEKSAFSRLSAAERLFVDSFKQVENDWAASRLAKDGRFELIGEQNRTRFKSLEQLKESLPTAAEFFGQSAPSWSLSKNAGTTKNDSTEKRNEISACPSDRSASIACPLTLSLIPKIEYGLFKALVSDAFITDLAADDSCKVEARRALVGLRKDVVDSLWPSGSYMYRRETEEEEAEDTNKPTTDTSQQRTREIGADSPRQQNPLEQLNNSPSRPRGPTNGNSFSPAAFLIPTSSNGEGGDSSDGGSDTCLGDRSNATRERSPHVTFPPSPHDDTANHLPMIKRPSEEQLCIFYQINLSAVRHVTPFLGDVVKNTIKEAEATVAKAILLNFSSNVGGIFPANSKKKSHQEKSSDLAESQAGTSAAAATSEKTHSVHPHPYALWELIVVSSVLPCVRRVAVLIALFYECLVLAIHVNTLIYFIETDGRGFGLASAIQKGKDSESKPSEVSTSIERVVEAAKKLLGERCSDLEEILKRIQYLSKRTPLLLPKNGDVRVSDKTAGPEEESSRRHSSSFLKCIIARDSTSSQSDAMQTHAYTPSKIYEAYPKIDNDNAMLNASLFAVPEVLLEADDGQPEPACSPSIEMCEIELVVVNILDSLLPRLNPDRFLAMKDIKLVLEAGRAYSRSSSTQKGE